MAIQSFFSAARGRAFALGVLFLTLFAVGCKDQTGEVQVVPTVSVWTFNEGQFGQSNAAITPYDPISKKASPDDIFAAANGGARLGDIPTSINNSMSSGLWVTISGSGKIYILDPITGVLKNKVTELNSPRHVWSVSNTKAYVSNVNKPEITIINPTTLATTGSIALESAAELFVKTSKGLFTNLWSFGKKIAKIDPETDKVTSSIEVGLQPVSMAADQNENLWVVCDGSYPGSPIGNEKPSLSKLNAEGTAVLHKWELPSTGGFSFRVAIPFQSNWIYVLCGDVYRLAPDATAFPTTPFIKLPTNVVGYSMGIDAESGDIYVGDAGDFQQRGTVYRFSKEGLALDNFKAGVAPAFFYFNPLK